MIIKRLDIWHLNLAFQSPIRHKLATHKDSQNLVVKVTTSDSVCGFGEGIPRAFVTGEVLEESLSFLQKVLAPAVMALNFESPQEIMATLAGFFQETAAYRYPGAVCALETALLDAAGKIWNMQAADLIGPKLRNSLVYSMVIPLISREPMGHLLDLVKMARLQYVKIKVGTDSDIETLKFVRDKLGPEVDLRVDANSAWSASEAVERIREMQPYRISAVEQPVPKADFTGLKQVSDAVDIPIIADESLCTEVDAQNLIDLKACRMFNIRLSKCGGLGAATRIKRMAEAAGLLCQLGCHVGETSILSAAGRHFALSSPHLTYVEGSFSPYLLVKDIVTTPLAFGLGGVASDLPGPGLGIQVLEETIKELALSHHQETAS